MKYMNALEVLARDVALAKEMGLESLEVRMKDLQGLLSLVTQGTAVRKAKKEVNTMDKKTLKEVAPKDLKKVNGGDMIQIPRVGPW